MKRTFILKQTCILLLFAAGFFPSLQAQVVGYWQFNEKTPGNMGDTNTGAILDASGNGHNGTESISLPYVAGSPAYGSSSAITFYTNGANDKIVVPDSAGAFNWSVNQSVTIEAVIRANSAGVNGSSAAGNIISKQGAVSSAALPGEWYFRLINAAGNVRFSASDGSLKSAVGTKSVLDGKWHHVAGVYDAAAHQLRVYVDYTLDATAAANYTGVDTIGNTNDLCLGQQNNNGARFDGDIDFIRFSLGALDPTNFVQASTSIANLSPANDAIFASPNDPASFTIGSAVGVPTTNITVIVNGSNITSQLVFSGDDNSRTVTLPALVANTLYDVNISATDYNGFQASQTWSFDTFLNSDFSFEGEDYNFGGGQFIDNPVLSSSDAPDNYLDQIGEEGIDFHQTNTPVFTQYRIGDAAGTKICGDTLRQAYLDAQASDPGVFDYMLEENADSEWVNYTRTFPAGTYRVYARLANPGTIPSVMQLDQVTSGSTTTSQTLAPIGVIKKSPTSSATDFQYAPLTDALGNQVGVSLNGINTLRLTFLSAGANVSLNYLLFVPVDSPQVPFVAAVSPAAGAENVAANTPIQISVRNADTSINTGAVQLNLDGTPVSPTISATSVGANISYSPSNLAIGWHTATLIFTDSAAASVTNQWQFFVADQSTLAYWKFDEQSPDNFVSTNAGAILDASGNQHNGTANLDTLQYVTGSFNYGNTPALHFNGNSGFVDVPDPSGVFIFTNSFTMEAIVRSTNTTTTQGAILAKNGLTDGEGEYWWRFPGASGGRQEVGMDGFFLTGTNALNDGQWHHVAVVYDATNNQVSLYADYVLEATGTNVFGSPIGRPTDLFLGSFVNGGSYLNADVDSIRISSGALTPDQFIPKTVALQPIVKSTLPTDGANNVAPGALIEAVIQNRDTTVAPGSLKLFVDGNDVTATATVSSDSSTAQIDYTPATPLNGGAHTATVIFQDTATPANDWTNSWDFNVLSSLPVLGLWQFNEKAPGDLADATPDAIIDSSGNGHNGTAVSQSGIPYIAGSPDYGDTVALGFTVTNASHIDVPDPDGAFNFHPNESFTLEAVLRTTNIGQSSVGSILAKQLAATPEWWWRINSNGKQQLNVNDGSGGKSVSGVKVLNDGQWHHLAVIYDGQAHQLRAYVDYVQDGNTASAVYASTNSVIGSAEDLWIGAFQAGNRIFEGDIDVVRVTKAALDPSWFIPLGGVESQPTALMLGNVVIANGNISFDFPSDSSHSYIIQSTGDLAGTWTNMTTISGDGTTKTFNAPATGAQQFFRILVQ